MELVFMDVYANRCGIGRVSDVIQMLTSMFICWLLTFCLFGPKTMQISRHGFRDFHAWPERQVWNDITWFVLVLGISWLLYQPELGAVFALIWVHFLGTACSTSRYGYLGSSSWVFSDCTMWYVDALYYFLVDVLIMLFIFLHNHWFLNCSADW